MFFLLFYVLIAKNNNLCDKVDTKKISPWLGLIPTIALSLSTFPLSFPDGTPIVNGH
jgi:hypothetical protein